MAHSARVSQTAGGRPIVGTADRRSTYDALKQAILRSEVAPGQPLVESALAAWLEVSRTPVREALNRLEQDGLIQRTDRGLMVRERSPEEILDIYETRIALEALVGQVAAERRTQYDVRTLRRLLEQSEGASDQDGRMQSNREFHQAMWRASHNESLIDLLARLNLHLARYPATTLSYPGRWARAREEHAALVDAIEKRNGAMAHEISHIHFTEARDIRLELWDLDPEG